MYHVKSQIIRLTRDVYHIGTLCELIWDMSPRYKTSITMLDVSQIVSHKFVTFLTKYN